MRDFNEIEFFKALTDETRLRILTILGIEGETCVCRLADALSEPEFKISRHLRVLKNNSIVTSRKEGLWSYYKIAENITTMEKHILELVAGFRLKNGITQEDFKRLENAYCKNNENILKEQDMKKVLFVCVHNSARSQMAEAFLKKYASNHFEVESAGLEPGELNPYVVRAMLEEGIDISKNETKSVFDFFKAGKVFNYIVAVCSKDAYEKCPIFPGVDVKRLHWEFPDPSSASGDDDQKLEVAKEVRDMINAKILEWLDETGIEVEK